MKDVYTWTLGMGVTTQAEGTLTVLPCACANLRRTARAVTRMYNQKLRATGLEVTQFTLLKVLKNRGEISQGDLGSLLALDTTTLTRAIALLRKHEWIVSRVGDDRRQRLLRLTTAGRQILQRSEPHWERAQKHLLRSLDEPTWNQMGELLTEVARASMRI